MVIQRPRFRRQLMEQTVFSPKWCKLKSSFWEICQERARKDSAFKREARRIKLMLSRGLITKVVADDMYFNALDVSIKRARA